MTTRERYVLPAADYRTLAKNREFTFRGDTLINALEDPQASTRRLPI